MPTDRPPASSAARNSFKTAAAPEGYRCYPRTDHILQAIQYYGDKEQYLSHSYLFDFFNRTVHVAQNAGASVKAPVAATNCIPFSQFDRDSLEWHHRKLTDMGRKPRALDPRPSRRSNKTAEPRRK